MTTGMLIGKLMRFPMGFGMFLLIFQTNPNDEKKGVPNEKSPYPIS